MDRVPGRRLERDRVLPQLASERGDPGFDLKERPGVFRAGRRPRVGQHPLDRLRRRSGDPQVPARRARIAPAERPDRGLPDPRLLVGSLRSGRDIGRDSGQELPGPWADERQHAPLRAPVLEGDVLAEVVLPQKLHHDRRAPSLALEPRHVARLAGHEVGEHAALRRDEEERARGVARRELVEPVRAEAVEIREALGARHLHEARVGAGEQRGAFARGAVPGRALELPCVTCSFGRGGAPWFRVGLHPSNLPAGESDLQRRRRRGVPCARERSGIGPGSSR